MGYAFGSIEELGDGPGFRKVRRALGVTAFGVNAIVFPPGFIGFNHFHERQDELYFVHSGRARFEVGDEVRELGPGGLCHVESTTDGLDLILESVSDSKLRGASQEIFTSRAKSWMSLMICWKTSIDSCLMSIGCRKLYASKRE